MQSRRHKKTYERHNIWRSYSDMMAGLLLLFVLVMCISFMEAQKNYQEKLLEEQAHKKTQTELELELSQRESEINAAQLALDDKEALLAQKQEELDKQVSLVLSQQEQLDDASAALAASQKELEDQNALMLQQQAALEEQETLMAAQQKKLEQIIGVKADLIAALKSEFDQHDLNVIIDESTGSIALDSNVLFGYNESELTEEGIAMLGEVLPIYCKVLMANQYQDYLAELSIDGYTDTKGDYLYNLQLSQSRALAVADYLFADAGKFLSAEELNNLKQKLTSNGHSMSNPVYKENGEIDMDASRRVEVRFRLKDEEMINEMKQILDNSALATTGE